MKRLSASFFLAAACVLTAEATIRTVSNNATNPAQYNSFQAAHDAANAGDTIYLHGSTTSYGSITISKQLTVIGTGHHPRKQNPLTSTTGSVTFSAAAASGSTLDGLAISYNVEGSAVNLNNITIRRCEIMNSIAVAYSGGGFLPMSNWLIENCIVYGFNGPFALTTYNNLDLNNWIIRNNIFYKDVRDFASPITLDHNLFYASSGNAFYDVKLATISNNVFYMMAPSGAANSTFMNNITYNTGADALPYGSNTGSGNVIGNPQFVNFPAAGAPFEALHNYNPQPGSPAHNAATDGTHIGVEGGTTKFSTSGEPWIPQVRAFNILNTSVPVGGQLNISVTVTKAEDQ